MLAACSSVPVGSMLKMASMNKDDITQIDPQQVRARITIDPPAELQTKEVKLALQFAFGGQTESEYLFSLDLVANEVVKDKPHWFSDEISRNRYEFIIHKDSLNDFKRYQREFRKYGKPEKYHWTVYYYLESMPAKGQPIELDLELKFSREEAYFYLLKGASVEVE